MGNEWNESKLLLLQITMTNYHHYVVHLTLAVTQNFNNVSHVHYIIISIINHINFNLIQWVQLTSNYNIIIIAKQRGSFKFFILYFLFQCSTSRLQIITIIKAAAFSFILYNLLLIYFVFYSSSFTEKQPQQTKTTTVIIIIINQWKMKTITILLLLQLLTFVLLTNYTQLLTI